MRQDSLQILRAQARPDATTRRRVRQSVVEQDAQDLRQTLAVRADGSAEPRPTEFCFSALSFS